MLTMTVRKMADLYMKNSRMHYGMFSLVCFVLLLFLLLFFVLLGKHIKLKQTAYIFFPLLLLLC